MMSTKELNKPFAKSSWAVNPTCQVSLTIQLEFSNISPKHSTNSALLIRLGRGHENWWLGRSEFVIINAAMPGNEHANVQLYQFGDKTILGHNVGHNQQISRGSAYDLVAQLIGNEALLTSSVERQ